MYEWLKCSNLGVITENIIFCGQQTLCMQVWRELAGRPDQVFYPYSGNSSIKKSKTYVKWYIRSGFSDKLPFSGWSFIIPELSLNRSYFEVIGRSRCWLKGSPQVAQIRFSIRIPGIIQFSIRIIWKIILLLRAFYWAHKRTCNCLILELSRIKSYF